MKIQNCFQRLDYNILSVLYISLIFFSFLLRNERIGQKVSQRDELNPHFSNNKKVEHI